MVASSLNMLQDIGLQDIGLQHLGHLILVTGPTRSGKSDWAETLAMHSQQSVLYIATALTPPDDPEWQARVQAHRDRRPVAWTTKEIPHHLSQAIAQLSSPEVLPPQCILIDALGTWVANELEQSAHQWEQTQTAFLDSLQTSCHRVICVAEEVGWGIVPAYPTGRLFRDRLGELVRRCGQIADQVYLVTAGYALDVKQIGTAIPQHIKLHQEMNPAP